MAEPHDIQALQQHCEERMRQGARSFSLAALLFDANTRSAVQFLYAWCRHCDDQIDEATHPAEAEARLSHLVQQTHMALGDRPVEDESFAALRWVFTTYEIPAEYAFELLEGMRMDLDHRSYQTLEDLKLYCFRVAGVVGLMMTHIMGVSHERALKHAVDLGMAMQMTNIARDIAEDRQLGRVYIPQAWLGHDDRPPSRMTAAAKTLVDTAENYYQSGLAGLDYLPINAGLAISSAAMIYREIGREVVRRGEHAWDERVVISFPRKLFLAVKGVAAMIPVILTRVRRRWRKQNIERVWRYS